MLAESFSRVVADLIQLTKLDSLNALINIPINICVCTYACREKYKVLSRHEVSVAEEQLTKLDSLNASYENYNLMLDETASRLERHKDNFREKVGVV